MQNAEQLHRESMKYAEQALLAKARGETEAAQELFHLAFETERDAANQLADQLEMEPSRSVLFRSAAALALDCGEMREAERLVAQALVGTPPEDIAEELRDVLDQANFLRHLRSKGVVLEQRDMQVSVAGPGIGHGFGEMRHLIDRISSIEQLIFRTAERKIGLPFREKGRRRKDIANRVDVFLCAPRPASLAVTLRLGRSEELEFPELDLAEQVLEEVLDCFSLLEERREVDLQKRIDSPAYHRNFLALARRIAPDGEEVRTVGLTKTTDGQERAVALSTPADEIRLPEEAPLDEEHEVVTVTGWLRFADSLKDRREIRVVDEDSNEHRVHVPEGMMDDIVRPLWDLEVRVTGVLSGKTIELDTIVAI